VTAGDISHVKPLSKISMLQQLICCVCYRIYEISAVNSLKIYTGLFRSFFILFLETFGKHGSKQSMLNVDLLNSCWYYPHQTNSPHSLITDHHVLCQFGNGASES
jgi:hypothetical protein